MNILVFNKGSSSLKCSLYHFDSFPEKTVKPVWESHSETNLSKVIASLWKGKKAPLQSLNDIDVIGHRIVHGGPLLKSVLMDAKVKKTIKRFAELTPLHHDEDIEVLQKLLPNTPQIAVFDTAFHHTLPESASVYPGPYSWIKEGYKRFGFHGISFQYCSKRASQILGRGHLKMIVCHLGSGASLCAIENGRSLDTTMGFTPLEGLMMSTRSGTIDPGLLLHLLKKQTPAELTQELYEQSGLLGLAGTSDMRELVAGQKNTRYKLALDVYIHRLNSLIGSMIASLQGLDVLVFTAGVGENVAFVRKKVAEAFSFLGLRLDERKNERKYANDANLSMRGSKVQVLLIHTEENFEIARECWLLGKE